MPHGYCFAWEPQVFWPMVIGHGVTFAAYMVLPVALWWYFRNRSVRRGDWLRRHLLFATFVGFCGVGHLILVVNLWRAHYLLEGVWACLTAAVSLWAAVVLLRALRQAPRRVTVDQVAKAFKTSAADVLRALESAEGNTRDFASNVSKTSA